MDKLLCFGHPGGRQSDEQVQRSEVEDPNHGSADLPAPRHGRDESEGQASGRQVTEAGGIGKLQRHAGVNRSSGPEHESQVGWRYARPSPEIGRRARRCSPSLP